MRIKRRNIMIFASTVALLTIVAVAIPYSNRIFVPSFGSLESFSKEWKNTAENDRHRLLKWILGKRPNRHTDYYETRLHALTRDEINQVLGTDCSEFDSTRYYQVGSIEFNVLDDWILYWLFPVGKHDHLRLEFDDNDRVSVVATGS